jgi:hypothetical protein
MNLKRIINQDRLRGARYMMLHSIWGDCDYISQVVLECVRCERDYLRSIGKSISVSNGGQRR